MMVDCTQMRVHYISSLNTVVNVTLSECRRAHLSLIFLTIFWQISAELTNTNTSPVLITQ